MKKWKNKINIDGYSIRKLKLVKLSEIIGIWPTIRYCETKCRFFAFPAAINLAFHCIHPENFTILNEKQLFFTPKKKIALKDFHY